MDNLMKTDKNKILQVQPTLLCLAIGSVLFGMPAFADDGKAVKINAAGENHVVLDDINLKVKQKINRKTNEITGLGKVVKKAGDIDQEMVLGIRDLTRYDPGISVVEQGKGATSGYAMRGVDKNRVAILVDGLNQAQSYLTLKTEANGGAINEVEYENIKSIELSKGSSSAEYGSGALGGAVGFVTKDATDVIKDGKNWGVNTKTAYTSKNKQWTQSVAGAFKAGGFDSLLIYTHKDGKETKGHKALDGYQHEYRPLTGYFSRYDLTGAPNDYSQHTYYLVENDCPSLDCTPLPRAKINNDRIAMRNSPALTSDEQAQVDAMGYPVHTASTKEYTGIDRLHANPMDYKSQSIFYKIGHDISERHRIGAVLEHTKQQYNIQDMTLPAYYTKQSIGSQSLGQGSIDADTGLAVGNSGIPDVADNPVSALVFRGGHHGNWGARYSNVRYFDEDHKKDRIGVSYQFHHPTTDGLVDKVKVSLDRQTLNLNSQVQKMRCQDYPNMGRCQAGVDRPWSWSGTEHNKYKERLTLAQISAEKSLQIAKSEHRLNLLVGTGGVKSILDRGALAFSYASAGYNHVSGKDIRKPEYGKVYVYERMPVTMQHGTACNNDRSDNSNCQPRTITGKHHFFALRDHIRFGDYVDLGLGLRYDDHRFNTDDEWTAVNDYKNWSYNAGLTVRPKDYLALSYRYSNGFRVPAFYEMYGVRTGTGLKSNELTSKAYQQRVAPRPEKATNHEFGVGIQGKFGTLETSYFRNHYKDLIAKADLKKSSSTISDFYNIQDITLDGINLLGRIDWYGVHHKLPDGLYSNIAYNRVRVKDRHIYDGFTLTTDPILDAIQPSRIIAGIGYDAPNGKWGFNHSLTYSKAKNPEELMGSAYYGKDIAIAVKSKVSRNWYTHDLTAYFMPHDNITLRAGIYNLMNYKYSTWESVRQSSINSVNQDLGTSNARYAAPGRNYALSLEMKF